MIYIPVPKVNRSLAIPEEVLNAMDREMTIEEALQLIVPIDPRNGVATRFAQASVMIAYADAHGYAVFQGV